MIKDAKESRTIFLLLTNQCNLRCSYCYEANKNTEKARYEQAIACLTQDINSNRDKFADFTIVFHGGEPFMEFDLLRRISEFLWETYPDLKLYCSATTNGTMLKEDSKQWLTENKHRFSCILSLDGGRETHNKQRCNSYDRIDREFFRALWPWQAVKMTIGPDTLQDMCANIRELHEEGFLVNPSLAGEVDWNMDVAPQQLKEQMDELITFYLERPSLYPCKMINISPEVFSPKNKVPHNRACGAGTNIIAYDVNGKAYPCHTFISDFNQHYSAEKIEPLFDKLAKRNGLQLSPLCEGCYAYCACSPCYGLNFCKRGAMENLDLTSCVFTKIRIHAAAKMYAMMLLNADKDYVLLRDKTDTEKANIIAGIQYLQQI